MDFNPIRVKPWLFRGPQPESVSDWNTLRDLGIKRILCLQTGSKLFQDGDPTSERKMAESYGMEFYHVPMGEIFPPNHYELDACNLILENVKHTPIFVHCRAGVDRTGITIGEHRIECDEWSTGKAINEMKSLGMHWHYAFWWPYFL